MTQLQPDNIVCDRYRIVRQVGQGGFGAVYEAVDKRLNRHVALKQLQFQTADPRTRERVSKQFEREAVLLANLDHPALPRVTDHFTDPTGQFLVMDFITGDDL